MDSQQVLPLQRLIVDYEVLSIVWRVFLRFAFNDYISLYFLYFLSSLNLLLIIHAAWNLLVRLQRSLDTSQDVWRQFHAFFFFFLPPFLPFFFPEFLLEVRAALNLSMVSFSSTRSGTSISWTWLWSGSSKKVVRSFKTTQTKMAVTVLQYIWIFELQSPAILLTIVSEGVEFEVILVELLILAHAELHHVKNLLLVIGTELVISQPQLL